jgi:hypothetical protein
MIDKEVTVKRLLNLLKMKLTALVARLNFDYKYFFEAINPSNWAEIKFFKLLSVLKDRFDLYLSEDDIELMFLYLNPKFEENSKIDSCITIVH